MPRLSVVIPLFNEEDVFEHLVRALEEALTNAGMLDHEVIETALNMPTSQLFDSRGGRAPIRSMLRSLDMPDTSEKRGFAVPLLRWLRGPLRDWASSLLLESDEDPLDQTAVAGIWQQLLNGRRDRAATIWTVLCWRSWLRGQSSR